MATAPGVPGTPGRGPEGMSVSQAMQPIELAEELVGSGFGTIVGYVAAHPFDTVKVRRQISVGCDPGSGLPYAFPSRSYGLQPKPSSTTFGIFMSILRQEGLRGLYRGLMPPLWGHIGLHWVLFPINRAAWRFCHWATDQSWPWSPHDEGARLLALRPYGSYPATNDTLSLMQLSLCGGFAGFFSAFISSPTELVKIRLQIQETHLRASHLLRQSAARAFQDHGLVPCSTHTDLSPRSTPTYIQVPGGTSTHLPWAHITNTHLQAHRTSAGLGAPWQGAGAAPATICPPQRRHLPFAGSANPRFAAARFTAAQPERAFADSVACGLHFARTYGLRRGIFRGQLITLLRDTPSYAAYFLSYEATKRAFVHAGLARPLAAPDAPVYGAERLRSWQLMTAGAIAGISCWSVMMPLDIVKTYIQSSPEHLFARPSEPLSVWFSRIYITGGATAFYRGMLVTYVRVVPLASITMLAYEWVKIAFHTMFPDSYADMPAPISA